MSPIVEHNIYPWLNKQLLEKALKISENVDSIRVIDYELCDAVAKGENYTSHLVRVSVKFLSNNASVSRHKKFIVKTTLAPKFNARFEKVALFKKEITFYRDILPKLNKYLDTIDSDFKFTPRCFAANENPSYLVFEDLKENDFRNMDRRLGLDMEATTMVLEKLAKYHAMGSMLALEEPQICEVFKIKVVDPDDTHVLNIFLCGIKDCQELTQGWPGYEHLSPKLEKLSKFLIERVQTVLHRDDTEFNVITHGDLWVNNIMFKFDTANNPIDVVLVDFQIGYLGSPAIDLAYFLYTSTTNDIKEEGWDRLLEIYHTELVKSLKSINYPKRIPSLTDIQIQMLKRSLYAVILSILILAPRHMDKTEHADVDLFIFDNMNVKKMRQALYDKPEVKERILYLLDYFDRKGFLDSD